MDLDALINDLDSMVAQARGLPLSASCVINRAGALERIADLRAALPAELQEARRVLGAAEALMSAAQARADAVLADAEAERTRRLSDAPEGTEASAWAEAVRAAAEESATGREQQADDYVEAKLANFEVVLEKSLELARRAGQGEATGASVGDLDGNLAELAEAFERTLASVRRGRERISGRHHMEDLGAHLRAMEGDAEAGPQT